LSTLLHEPQTIFKRENSGESQRSIFAETQTRGGFALGNNIGNLRFQQFQSGNAQREDGGLTHNRRVEFFGGTLVAQSGEIVTENGTRSIKQVFGTGILIENRFAHTDRLRTLTGK
jgi:hypothetical protein